MSYFSPLDSIPKYLVYTTAGETSGYTPAHLYHENTHFRRSAGFDGHSDWVAQGVKLSGNEFLLTPLPTSEVDFILKQTLVEDATPIARGNLPPGQTSGFSLCRSNPQTVPIVCSPV